MTCLRRTSICAFLQSLCFDTFPRVVLLFFLVSMERSLVRLTSLRCSKLEIRIIVLLQKRCWRSARWVQFESTLFDVPQPCRLMRERYYAFLRSFSSFKTITI